MKFQGCFKEDSRVFCGSFMVGLLVFQRCSSCKDYSKIFLGSFKRIEEGFKVA